MVVIDGPHVGQEPRLHRVDEMLAPHLLKHCQVVIIISVHPFNDLLKIEIESQATVMSSYYELSN